MRKKFSGSAVCLALLTLIAVPTVASAAVYYGCFNCKPLGPTGIGGSCSGAGDGGTREGTECHEVPGSGVWPDGPLCYTGGNPCYEAVVNDGGGGLSSGGDSVSRGGPG